MRRGVFVEAFYQFLDPLPVLVHERLLDVLHVTGEGELHVEVMRSRYMVGSDEGGSALLMFPQPVHTLKVDVQAVLGDSLSVVQDFAEAISLCMFEYIPMRKYATVDQLQKLLAEFYGAPPHDGCRCGRQHHPYRIRRP